MQCVSNILDEKTSKTIKELTIEDKEKGQLRFDQRRLKKRLKEIPGDKTSIKHQLSNIKEKNPCHITSGKRKETAVKKRKARCAFDKNPIKFPKKLSEEEKNGILNAPKETLEAHLQRKYSDPLADTPMGDFSELNRPQPPEETFDNSPIKLGEVKDFV